MSRKTIIRSIHDFTAVPEGELAACLRAFRVAIQAAKANAAQVAATGHSPDRVRLDEFVWDAKASAKDVPGQLLPTSLIDEMPLRPSVKQKLKQARIYCLEDLSEISERELLGMKDMGRTSVQQLREMLSKVGMSFKAHPNPVIAQYDASRAVRKVDVKERAATVTDDSHVSEIGLSRPALTRTLARGYKTVGDLRALTVRTYATNFGPAQAREIISTLSALGRPLLAAPTPLELWRAGILKKTDLPTDIEREAPTAHLAPWIGSAATAALTRHGAKTVKEVGQMARAGLLKDVPGIGAMTATAIAEFLRKRGL